MLLYLYMLCFSQATVSVKISNFVSVVFMSYPIDNLKKKKMLFIQKREREREREREGGGG